jgi:signal transduction histidine kinase/CheY-like chemotaxis protein
MSKKQLYNRLDTLFSDIDEDTTVLPVAVPEKMNGWTWECNADGTYKMVSPDVEKCLGIPVGSFIGKSIHEFAIRHENGDQLRSMIQAKNQAFDLEVQFYSSNAKWTKARLHVFSRGVDENTAAGWRGFCQVISSARASKLELTSLTPEVIEPANPVIPQTTQLVAKKPRTKTPGPAVNIDVLQPPSRMPGVSWQDGQIEKASNPWTRAGIESLLTQKPVTLTRSDSSPAAMAIPFQYGNAGKGILEIVDDYRENWTEDEHQLVQEVANQLVLAIENARLYAAVQSELTERIRVEDEILRRNLELEAAAEIARDTTSTLALDALLNRIVNMVIDRFNFYHAAVFLADDENIYVIIQEATGEAGRLLKERKYRIPIGSKTIVGTVAASGNTITVNDVQKSLIYTINPLLPETRSELALPLKLGDRIIGVLDIQSNNINAFMQDDIAVLQILADQIAVAIDNARSYALAQKAIEEIREVDRLKSQFLANMSHELRTPLNSIIGFSRVILKGIDGPINEIQQQDLSAIYNSGQHLLNLINNILDISKIEAGKMDLSISDVDLNEIVKAVMSTATGLVKDKPVQLKQVVPPDMPPIKADATRIRQVLLNLISNAAKFTEEGQIIIEVTRSRDSSGHPEVMVTVTDSGPGIAKEDEVKLFQPFSQVDDSPTRKTGGTGLGLSICRSMIELHNGHIGLLWSEVGKGSTFYFTLPMTDPQNTGEDGQPVLTLLAVDDDPQITRLYERYLAPQGYMVVSCTDPRQAVAKAKTLKPFAITLDVMMPEKDGWQVLKDLKNDPATKDIPIIVCSILEEEEKGFSLGASEYLVKPFLREDLITAISRLNPNNTIRKVLVIDDDPDALRLLEKMLSEAGNMELITAGSGKDGWLAIQADSPDAVILDLFMPDLDGFTILEQMRGNPRFANIPAVILTGAELSPEQNKQLQELNQQMLTKGSLDKDALLDSLEKALQQFRH